MDFYVFVDRMKEAVCAAWCVCACISLHVYKIPDAKTPELKSAKTCKSVRCLTPTQHLFFLSVTQPIRRLRHTVKHLLCVSLRTHKGTYA